MYFKKKYELTNETKVLENGTKVYRIRSLDKFMTANYHEVQTGELGGWVESEKNLQHYDEKGYRCNAWISDDACVFGEALVKDDACVQANAIVSGNAVISEKALISDDVKVGDNACVCGHAYVYGRSIVGGNAEIRAFAEIKGDSAIKGDAVIGGCAYIKDNALIEKPEDFYTTTSPGFDMRKGGWYKTEYGVTFFKNAYGGISVTYTSVFYEAMPLDEYVHFVKTYFNREKDININLNRVAKVCKQMGVEVPENLYETI